MHPQGGKEKGASPGPFRPEHYVGWCTGMTLQNAWVQPLTVWRVGIEGIVKRKVKFDRKSTCVKGGDSDKFIFEGLEQYRFKQQISNRLEVMG